MQETSGNAQLVDARRYTLVGWRRWRLMDVSFRCARDRGRCVRCGPAGELGCDHAGGRGLGGQIRPQQLHPGLSRLGCKCRVGTAERGRVPAAGRSSHQDMMSVSANLNVAIATVLTPDLGRGWRERRTAAAPCPGQLQCPIRVGTPLRSAVLYWISTHHDRPRQAHIAVAWWRRCRNAGPGEGHASAA